MKFSSTVLVLLSAIGAIATPLAGEKVKNYAGSKVFRVSVHTDADVERMNNVIGSMGLDTWTHHVAKNSNIDVVVHAEDITKFKQKVGTMIHSVMHDDLQKSIEEESKFEPYQRTVGAAVPPLSYFNSYHTPADHTAFLTDLHNAFPGNSELITSGTSNQGQPINGIHIWNPRNVKGSKPAAIYHGNVHAREWVTSMTVEYLAYQLLLTSNSTTSYTNKLDFYIFPIVNPDGFAYTQTSANRLWRKNRQTNTGSSCAGRDINRNWPYKWEVPGGASTDPCDETYKGVTAGDATENSALRAFINSKINSPAGAKMFIDFHSYSQLLMSPYGYTCDSVPPDNDELQTIMQGWAQAFTSVYQTQLQYGPVCTTIYQATGSSIDWTYGAAGIKYSFTLELRDQGNYGFVLPANQILPSGRENFAGLLAALAQLKY